MGSFGERLQRERELRGISLEEIAEATKIGTRSLRALEQQDFDQLPGGIFNKGFVRAYARYLGLDEEQAVADYLAALAEAIAAGKATRQESTANTTTPERNLPLEDLNQREPLRLPIAPILVLLVIAVLLFSGWKYYSRHGLPKLHRVRAAAQQQTPPPKSNPAPQAAPQPAISGETPAPASPILQRAAASTLHPIPTPAAAPEKDSFTVSVKAKDISWISISADGKTVLEDTLTAGAQKTFRAQRSVVLKVGDASALEVFYNDKLVPLQGTSGQVKTIEFTSAGVRR